MVNVLERSLKHHKGKPSDEIAPIKAQAAKQA